jgi:hypothetical protein
MPPEPYKERRMIQVIRPITIAAGLSACIATFATAQSGGTMGMPRLVTSQPTASTPSMGGTMSVPSRPWGYTPRSGDLPRLVTGPTRRPGSGYAFGGGRMYGSGSSYNAPRGDRGTRYGRQPYTRWGAGAGCGYGCFNSGVGFHSKRPYGSYFVGYPFGVPVLLPYYESSYVAYSEIPADAYAVGPEEPIRAPSKLIVVGGGTGGGDALTVETLGDSVRLRWLGAGRPASDVKLFVADSAQRQLASRSASPSAPVATFEVVTLSAPVAFVGVSVTFVDGVTSTTLVPYRQGAPGQRR